jgi:hypothetical protein
VGDEFECCLGVLGFSEHCNSVCLLKGGVGTQLSNRICPLRVL